MSYAQRLRLITAIVTTVTDFADKHSEACCAVSIDCGMYEVVTIKLRNVHDNTGDRKERIHVYLYEDEVKVEGTFRNSYEDLQLFVEKLQRFLFHKYKDYF